MILTAYICLGLFVLIVSTGLPAQSSRTSSGKTTAVNLTGVNTKIEKLSSQMNSLKQENVRLKKRLSRIDWKLKDLTLKIRAQNSSGTLKVKSNKWELLKEIIANWVEFKAKVLSIVMPEIDPINAKLADLGNHVHEYTKASYGYGTLKTIQNCDGCLIPFVAPHKQGKMNKVKTSGPK